MTEIEDKVDQFVATSDGVSLNADKPKEDATMPQYKMLSTEKILVSKSAGKIWEARKKTAIATIQDSGELDRWDDAIRYYRNDHGERSRGENSQQVAVKATTRGLETENIVFANATALVPAVYAKNPKVELTSKREELQDWADAQEHLINALFEKKGTPGVNLKPKMKRAVLMSTLTNVSYIECGYIVKEESSEHTLATITSLGTEYAECTDKNRMQEIEQELVALEEKVDVLRPSGPWVRFRKPHDVLVDGDGSDLDECMWIMIREYLPTDFIKAMYGQKNEDGEWGSIYQPSHVMKAASRGIQGVDDDLTQFTMFDSSSGKKAAKDYGYKDDEAFTKAQRTCVWYVWDKATRRVFLFNDKDWKWPLWVWNDPYGFPDFFPIVPLEFYMDPAEYYGRSETLYYLDQQDGINAINNEIAKCRSYIAGKVLYNSSVIKDEKLIEAFLSGTSPKRAFGINVPADVDLSKAFAPVVPQSAHMLNTVVFDKQRLIEAIDRVSSVTNVMRGVEYKTNTTNKAIESYESNTQTRLDEKIDAVEDCLAAIGTKIGHMCLQHMSKEDVEKLIGTAEAEIWEQNKPDIQNIGAYLNISVAGGSTLKPTSVTKKQQAVQVAQSLGQFANATPTAVLVMLRVLERAFDEVVITKDDWRRIEEDIANKLGGAGAAAGGEGGGGVPIEELEKLVDSLPPDLKEEVGRAIAKGMPLKQVIAGIAKIQQQSQEKPQGNPAQE